MSFLERAKHAAEEAAEQAKEAAAQAGVQARTATERVKRGLTPERLADLIVTATALQERTNTTLKRKGSPYRVTEISITASLPPQVGFVIGRLLDPDVAGEVVASADLVERSGGEAILELQPQGGRETEEQPATGEQTLP